MVWLSQQLVSAMERDSGGIHGMFKHSLTHSLSPGDATGWDRMQEAKRSPVISDVDTTMIDILERGNIYIREIVNRYTSTGNRIMEEERKMDARADETGDNLRAVRRWHDVSTTTGTVSRQERDGPSKITVTFTRCVLFLFFPICYHTTIELSTGVNDVNFIWFFG